jgi:hypothetical protein
MANESETGRDSVTTALPESRRARREAKAIAIIKNIPPKPVIVPPPIRYVPIKPDATFTYRGHPNAAPIAGSVIYFMYSAGRVKIGISTGLRNRHLGLRGAGPFPPIVLMIVPGTEKEEKEYHRKFAADRMHGEWFALSAKLRGFLRGNLCDTGRASLEAADAQFMEYCAGFVAAYRPPPKRKERSADAYCEHGKLKHLACTPCAVEIDLKILEKLNERGAANRPTTTDHQSLSRPIGGAA